ncbi:M81 family metallopeptidase [Urechidicola sp. P050]|uniref:M81 family metallopeptidase n=1 Tax=Urechidicola vernalis TaxID=3075600 RepID=A0ABU2Y2X6_9FLAO|nr:M81 family metallopeptidase [Urechidicola sp. P050]MDT0552387.1 M81 family metallopeptidase [Urechidicola sp. P050]
MQLIITTGKNQHYNQSKTTMNKYILLIALSISLFSCKENSTNLKKKLPKIAIAGIAIESSTFSPAKSHIEAFHPVTGEVIFNSYPFFSKDSVNRNRADWYPTLRGRSLPGGITTREAYEEMVEKTLKMLKENLPYDGLFFDIHGAMSVVGVDDPEGDFIQRIREIIGNETLISTSMDLHGNVSERLAHHSDLITCYRMAPHEDALESKKRAVDNLLERLESGKGKPKYKAWIPVPILLPGEKTSTRIEPGKSLYAKVDPLTKKEGVVDAAIWIGYAWADEPRNHAAIVVTGDDKNEVSESAEYLAKSMWDVRNQFDFVAPTTNYKQAISKAIKSDKKPFMISDMGDNPTAGGAGDVTWTISELLKNKALINSNKQLIYASIPGPNFVAKAIEIGVGGTINEVAGALVDNRYAPPVRLNGTITAIKHGDKHAETEVVVKVGNISVIVTKKRKPYHRKSDFTNLNLDPNNADIVVVKIGYLVPELYDMRGDWIMALTPGGVDQDLDRLGHKSIKRPMFPIDANMKDPNLSTRFIPLSHQQKNY